MRVLELKHQKSVEAVFKNPDISEDFINEQFKESPPLKKPEPPKVFKEELEKKDFALEKPEEMLEEKKELVEEKQENSQENHAEAQENHKMPDVD